MKFFEWEDQVCIHIEDALGITRSDAQALVEANEKLLYAQWEAKRGPQAAAEVISAI